MERSRVCACRGCEHHAGTCGWPTTNERRCDRCGRPGFANRFRHTPDHPVAADVGLASAGEADRRGPRRGPWLALPGLASRAASGATRRARGRPSPSRSFSVANRYLARAAVLLRASCNARKGSSQRRRRGRGTTGGLVGCSPHRRGSQCIGRGPHVRQHRRPGGRHCRHCGVGLPRALRRAVRGPHARHFARPPDVVVSVAPGSSEDGLTRITKFGHVCECHVVPWVWPGEGLEPGPSG